MVLFGNKSSRSDKLNGVVNASKTLLANIRFMSVDDPVKSIVITSAVPNEGKTFVAANLASAIATSGRTVLVVECDMRRRSMASVLGAHAQYGLYAVVAGEVPLTQAAVATDTPNLYFLDAEPHIPNPSDLLNSNRFTKLVDLARNTYDYVVFDTPPVCTFVDAAVLGTKVDAVFMVVREGFTRKADVANAADQLRKSGCNLAGMIMNYCERTSSEYYYQYYYYTRDDKKASSNTNAPQMPAPKGRPQRAARSTQVPSAPPERRRTPEPEDTGTYERLAEQLADGSSSSEAASTPVPTTPYVPQSSYDEF